MFWSLLCVRMPTYFGALIVVTQGVCRLAIIVCLAELALMASPFPATAHGKHAQPMLPSKGGFCRHRATPATDAAGVMGHSVCDSRRPFSLQFFSILAVAASIGGAILYVHERTTHTYQTNTNKHTTTITHTRSESVAAATSKDEHTHKY